jgi:hypothetical protein
MEKPPEFAGALTFWLCLDKVFSDAKSEAPRKTEAKSDRHGMNLSTFIHSVARLKRASGIPFNRRLEIKNLSL